MIPLLSAALPFGNTELRFPNGELEFERQTMPMIADPDRSVGKWWPSDREIEGMES